MMIPIAESIPNQCIELGPVLCIPLAFSEGDPSEI